MRVITVSLGLNVAGYAPMNTYLSTNQSCANSFDPPPVLIVADTEAAKSRGRHTVTMAGFRVAEADGIAAARARIREQAAASALWIELDGGAPPSLEALLDDVADEVSSGRSPAIIAAPATLIDRFGPHLFATGIDILIDPTDDQRIAALAVAVSSGLAPTSVADAGTDKNAARLRQLSDEVGRIAATLARLSTGPTASVQPTELPRVGEVPDVSAETVRAVIRARRLRSRYFPDELFADPAWDMLLDLLQAEIAKLRVPVSSLCIAAAVPATTALRWLKSMVQEGIFIRRADPHDGRRVFVELAPETSHALRRYFAEVGQVAVI